MAARVLALARARACGLGLVCAKIAPELRVVCAALVRPISLSVSRTPWRELSSKPPLTALVCSVAAAIAFARSTTELAGVERPLASPDAPLPSASPESERWTGRSAIVRGLCSEVAAVSWWRVALRGCWLALLVAPAALVAPLAWLVPPLRGVWWRLARWTLATAGPLAIKAAQWASTRPDLFSVDACAVLAELQDLAPAHVWRGTRRTLERALGAPLDSVFAWIEPVPLAAGSVAQVHRAQLAGAGARQVAVKVAHPWTRELVTVDLALAALVGSWLASVDALAFLGIDTAVAQLSENVLAQIDLTIEAANLDRFARDFASKPGVRFPTPVHALCSREVLVASFEHGVPLTSYVAARRAEPNAREVERALAVRGMDVFLHMLLEHNFVHGDMHPGNVLVAPWGPGAYEFDLVLVDAGLVTELTPDLRRKLFSLLDAVLAGDGERGARLMLLQAGTSCASPDAFVAELTRVFDTIRTVPLGELPLGHLLDATFAAMARHHVRCEAQFASMMVAILIAEGIARSLHPEQNLAAQIAAFLMRGKDGRATLLRGVYERRMRGDPV